MSTTSRDYVGRLTVCACALLCPLELAAQDLWGGSLTLTNDYRIRGVSHTSGDAAIQGGVHAQPATGWIVGAWSSNVSRDRGRRSAIELDVYGGYAWSVAKDWDAKVTVTHYSYLNDPATTRYDYDELSASLAFRSQFVATVAWSPNSKYFSRYQGVWHAADGETAAYEITGLQPITPVLALTAGVGYNDLTRLFDAGYWYWNAGLTYSMGPVQLDVSRIDSDAQAEYLFGSIVSEAGWSAAISWRF